MKSAVIYPFTEKDIPIVRHWNLTREHLKIIYAVMINPVGLAEKDIGLIWNKPNMGVKICPDIMSALKESDVLIAAEEKDDEHNLLVLLSIEKALLLKKDVICMHPLSREQRELFSLIAIEMEVNFEYCCLDSAQEGISYDSRELFKTGTPVVTVGEMYEGLDGTDIALSIGRMMSGRGYKCITILEGKYPILPEVISFPDFMRELTMQNDEKVYSFSKFITEVEKRFKPDIIIIKIPDAMMKYSDRICLGFGIIPFLVSKGILVDYFVFCTQYDDVDTKFYDLINENFIKSYGYQVDFVHMSNTELDIQESEVFSEVSLLRNSYDNQMKLLEYFKYSVGGIPIRNCCEEIGLNELCDDIIVKLSKGNNIDYVF